MSVAKVLIKKSLPQWKLHLKRMWAISSKSKLNQMDIQEIVKNCRRARKEIYDEEYQGRYSHLSGQR